MARKNICCWNMEPGNIKATIPDLQKLNNLYKSYEEFIKNHSDDESIELESFKKIVNAGGEKLLNNIAKGFEFFEEHLEKYAIPGRKGIPKNYELHAGSFERRHDQYDGDWSDFFKLKKSIGTVIKGEDKTIDLDFRYHPVGVSGQAENIGFTIREKDNENPFYNNINAESRSKLDLENYQTFPKNQKEVDGFKKSIDNFVLKTEGEVSLRAFNDFLLKNNSFNEEDLYKAIENNQGNHENIKGYSINQRIQNSLKEGSLKDNGEKADLRYTVLI